MAVQRGVALTHRGASLGCGRRLLSTLLSDGRVFDRGRGSDGWRCYGPHVAPRGLAVATAATRRHVQQEDDDWRILLHRRPHAQGGKS